jgi:hypothetical protein
MLRETAARTAGISPAKEKRGRHLVFDFARGCRDLPLAAFHFPVGGIFTLELIHPAVKTPAQDPRVTS